MLAAFVLVAVQPTFPQKLNEAIRLSDNHLVGMKDQAAHAEDPWDHCSNT